MMQVQAENDHLKQALNLNITNLDALEQYNRKENINNTQFFIRT